MYEGMLLRFPTSNSLLIFEAEARELGALVFPQSEDSSNHADAPQSVNSSEHADDERSEKESTFNKIRQRSERDPNRTVNWAEQLQNIH